MALMLYRVEAPHFAAGLVVDTTSQNIVRTAPILSWARGKDFASTSLYFAKKSWTCEHVDTIEE